MRKIVLFSIVASTVWALGGAAGASETPSRDGRRFDPGRDMTQRAAGAPEALDRVTGFLGQWDVEVRRPVPAGAEGEPVRAKGRAEITFMNRGHALMERFHTADFGGRSLSSMRFLGYNPGASRWWLGGANNRAESVWVADGAFNGPRLVLSDTRRLNGGVQRTEFRYTFEQPAENALKFALENSTDGGKTWTMVETRVYTRRTPTPDFLATGSGYGSPDPARPTEANGFDFLIGEWINTHDMTFPNGQKARWSVNATAVHALDGAAVLEYNHFNVDPSLPDAATTILRVYNRAMRRWENLFASNRGNGILVFGGRQEGDRVVLGNFAIDTSAATIPRFVFHSIKKDTYSWYSEASPDGGTTWTKTWLIDAKRNRPDAKATP